MSAAVAIELCWPSAAVAAVAAAAAAAVANPGLIRGEHLFLLLLQHNDNLPSRLCEHYWHTRPRSHWNLIHR